jgi:uncharacterized membrane protein
MPSLFADADAAARAAADKWLALLDRGKYRDAWKQASRHHRPQVTADEWEAQIRAMREASGALRERTFTSSRISRTLPGAPDGDYTTLEYATAFEKKSKAVEHVVLSREGNNWKAAGYSIS